MRVMRIMIYAYTWFIYPKMPNFYCYLPCHFLFSYGLLSPKIMISARDYLRVAEFSISYFIIVKP